MIKLKELLHTDRKFVGANDDDNDKEPVENWPWIHYQHLKDMDFQEDQEFSLKLKNPQISIYRKNKKYYISEPKKETVECDTFNKVINYFDNYKQDFENS